MKSPLEPARPPVGDDCPTAFTRSAALEVAEATRYVRGMQRNRPIFPGRPPRGNGGVLRKAKTGSGGIAAGSASGATPGSGTVTFYTSLTSGSLVLGTETATAYNFTTTAVGASKPVTVAPLDIGVWEVVLEPC